MSLDIKKLLTFGMTNSMNKRNTKTSSKRMVGLYPNLHVLLFKNTLLCERAHLDTEDSKQAISLNCKMRTTKSTCVLLINRERKKITNLPVARSLG